MARRPARLPKGTPAAFRVADAVARGIPRGRLFRGGLERPHHGVRALPTEAEPIEAVTERQRRQLELRQDHLQRLRTYVPALTPNAYFCGPSAALLWGIPLPPREWPDLHVGVPRPARAPRREGVIGHQHSAGYVQVVELDGIPVTDPASTWASLGGVLYDDDLVISADHVLHIPRMPGGFRELDEVALASREQLEILAECKGRPGAPRLRRALELARTGAASPPETRIRLLIRGAHLPEPVLDHDVYDASGRFLGCSELAYPQSKVAIEYESDGHLSQAQLQRDIDKYQAYAEAGWSTVRLTSLHVFQHPGEAVRRIRQALRRAS